MSQDGFRIHGRRALVAYASVLLALAFFLGGAVATAAPASACPPDPPLCKWAGDYMQVAVAASQYSNSIKVQASTITVFTTCKNAVPAWSMYAFELKSVVRDDHQPSDLAMFAVDKRARTLRLTQGGKIPSSTISVLVLVQYTFKGESHLTGGTVTFHWDLATHTLAPASVPFAPISSAGRLDLALDSELA